MSAIDLERLLSEPIFAMDFQYMIGDIEDFLDFAERHIEWQYRQELRDIRRRSDNEEFPPEFREHFETNAQHRFKVSLPLRVRYGAVIALATSVEWSVGFLVKRLKDPLSKVPRGRNETVHGLLEVQQRTQRRGAIVSHGGLSSGLGRGRVVTAIEPDRGHRLEMCERNVTSSG